MRIKRRNYIKSIFILLACVLIAFGLGGCEQTSYAALVEQLPDADFSMHVIDVDQGDSILLESNGSYMLLDAGQNNDQHPTAAYLNSLGVTKLDYVVITHSHSDHCGDMLYTLKQFTVGELIMPNESHTTRIWEKLVDYITESDIYVNQAEAGDTYLLGGAEIKILSPTIPPQEYDGDLNNTSIVIKAIYKDVSFLLTGDAEKPVENHLMQEGADLSSTVLKLGHHGSASSSQKDFIQAVNPTAGVVSCGKDNSYGHPHKEVLSTFEQMRVPLFRTDLLGTIVFSTNGESLSVTSQKDSSTTTVVDSSVNESLSEAVSEPYTGVSSSSSEIIQSYAEEEDEQLYIGNKNSKKFHFQGCPSVTQIAEKNRIEFLSRQQADKQGYSPCKQCNP